jgi:hypothetical protein
LTDHGARGLDETTSTALCVNFAEPFGLLALFHDTKRRNEQACGDGGEPVDRCERLVQQEVRLARKLVHAPNCSVRDLECRAHGTTDFHVGTVAVPTAIPLVLQCETRLRGGGNPHFLKVAFFLEGAEPEDGREDDGKGRVKDEEPIEDDETDGDMVALDNCANGNNERDRIEDSEYRAAGEVHFSQNEIPKDVGCLPEDAKRDCDASGCKEKEVEGTPDGHQHNGHHDCRLQGDFGGQKGGMGRVGPSTKERCVELVEKTTRLARGEVLHEE